MSIDIIEVTSNTDIDLVIPFCKLADLDSRPAASNIKFTNWENAPNSLLYKIYIDKAYDGESSGYCIYQDSETEQYLFGSGYLPFVLDKNILVGGSRVYAPIDKSITGPQYHQYLKDYPIRIALEHGYKGLCIYTNEYNKKIIRTIMFINDKKRVRYKSNEKDPYPTKLVGPYNVNSVPQYVLYILFDTTYEQTFLNILESNPVENFKHQKH